MTDLNELFEAQRQLQIKSYGKDPVALTGEERADFATWNSYALIDELSEAMQELKWKPWLTSTRGDWVDRDAFVGELVDALHFFMNLALLAGCTGEEMATRYFIKRGTNARRQAEGYTGEKDADGRELDRDPVLEVGHPHRVVLEPDMNDAQREHVRRQVEKGYRDRD